MGQEQELIDALRQENAALLELDRIKSRFLADMSHELRAPLAGVVQLVDTLLAEAPTDKQTKYLSLVRAQIADLADLVNDLRDLTRLESGLDPLVFGYFALPELTEGLIPLVEQGLIQGKPIRFVTDCPPDLPPVYGDAQKIRQVLVNFLSNAVKFTPQGEVALVVHLKGDQVQISIKDTGVGIREDEIREIFERFRRVGERVPREYEGSGLGLAINKAIIERHGGELGVVSSFGHGSTFSFTLPTHPIDPPTVHIPASAAHDQSSGRLRELERQVTESARQLKEAQRQLYQSDKMSSLGQLTAGIAHEINNPLAFVMANMDLIERKAWALFRRVVLQTLSGEPMLEILLADPAYARDVLDFRDDYERAPADQQPALLAAFRNYVLERERTLDGEPLELRDTLVRLAAGCREGLERVRSIVQELRSFSRLDEAEQQEADIHSGLDSCLTILNHQFVDKGVKVERRYRLDSPVTCNPGRLNQVFLNLLANALHAVPPGGLVTLETRRRGARAVIEIADNGPGVPDALQGRIFDPFFTTKPVGEGTGLGLAIAFQIVQDHKGSIRVASQPGQTRFVVELPV